MRGNHCSDKIFARIVLVAVLVSPLLSMPAVAEQSIKRMVITDCAQAKEAILKVPDKDRLELVKFLGLILKRKTARPDQVGLDFGGASKKISPFESPLDESSPGDISSFLDPTHEKDAKNCALTLLRMLGAASQDTIPILVDRYAERTLPEVQRFEVAQTVIHIAKSVREEGVELSRSVVHSLVPNLIKSDSILSRNVFVEIGAKSLSLLVDELQSPDTELRSAISNLILEMKLEATDLDPQLTRMVEAADPMVRLEGLKIIQGSDVALQAQFVGRIITALRDMHPDVRYQAAKTLGQFASLGSKSMEVLRPHIGEILSFATLSPGVYLDGIWSCIRALAKEGEISEKIFLSLLADQDEGVVVRALGMPLDRIGNSQELLDRLIQLTKAKSVKVQALAISALGKKGNPTKLTKIFTEALKGSDRSIIQAVSAALLDLKISKLPSDLLGQLLRGLPDISIEDLTQSQDPVVQLLTKVGGQSSSSIVRELPQLLLPQRILAIRLLATTSPGDQKVQDLLLSTIGTKPDKAMLRALEPALAKPTKATIKALYKLLKDKNPAIRGFAARVVALAGEKDPTILPILVAESQSPDCIEKSESLRAVKAFQGSVTTSMVRDVVECAKRGLISNPFLDSSIQNMLPMDQDSVNYLLEVLQDSSVDSQVRLSILKMADKFHLSQPEFAAAMVRIFESRDNPFRLATIEILSGLDSRKQISQQKLMDVLRSNGAELMLLHEMAVLSANTDGSDFNSVDFLVDELRSKNSDWAIRSLGRIPANMVALAVDRSLDKVSTPVKVKLLGVAANVGGPISALAPKIGALLESPLPEIMHAATQALLSIDPNFESLRAGVRRMVYELGTDGFVAVKKPYSEGLLKLLNTLEAESGTRFERVTYKRLLG